VLNKVHPLIVHLYTEEFLRKKKKETMFIQKHDPERRRR
jgi:hypothetical protein